MKPPAIIMLTPSGRFQINTKICMSMSDYHPESWNPMWTVGNIIKGIQSFMSSEELTTGGLKASKTERKNLAKSSAAYNKKMFPKLFQSDIEGALEKAEQPQQKVEKESVKDNTSVNDCVLNNGSKKLSRRERRLARGNKSETKLDQANAIHEEYDGDTRKSHDQKVDPCTNEELSPDAIERRRKKNAKKRAKQKAKRAVVSSSQAKVDEEINATSEMIEETSIN